MLTLLRAQNATQKKEPCADLLFPALSTAPVHVVRIASWASSVAKEFFFLLNDAKTDASCLEMTLELKIVILRNLLFSQSDARANV